MIIFRVRLAYNTKSYVQYAVKLIRHERMNGKEELIRKEVLFKGILIIAPFRIEYLCFIYPSYHS